MFLCATIQISLILLICTIQGRSYLNGLPLLNLAFPIIEISISKVHETKNSYAELKFCDNISRINSGILHN